MACVQADDGFRNAIFQLFGSNAGTAEVQDFLQQLQQHSLIVNGPGGADLLAQLKTLEISAQQVLDLYNCVCEESKTAFLAVFKAVELGLLSEENLVLAIKNEHWTDQIDLRWLWEKVQQRIPNFNPRLPKEVRLGTWNDLNQMGVEIVDREGPFYIFHQVVLPRGWSIENVQSDHSGLHQRLVDDSGRERATILYRNFRDVEAYLDLCCRYRVVSKAEPPQFVGEQVVNLYSAKVVDTATGKELLSTTSSYLFSKQVAENWLDERFPNWKLPSAYWDA